MVIVQCSPKMNLAHRSEKIGMMRTTPAGAASDVKREAGKAEAPDRTGKRATRADGCDAPNGELPLAARVIAGASEAGLHLLKCILASQTRGPITKPWGSATILMTVWKGAHLELIG
jgi:hypothetical protein